MTLNKRLAGIGLLVLGGLLGSTPFAANAVLSPFGPRLYSGPAATFRIVDPNGRPIPGAIALMDWSYMESNGASQRVFKVIEIEADSHGVIRVPGWGPIITPFGTRMIANMPRLRVFKPGYLPIFDLNTTVEYWEEAPASMALQWDGKTIVLAAADRHGNQYLDQLQALSGSMSFYLDPKQCWPASSYRLIDALNPELNELMPQGVAGRSFQPNRHGCITDTRIRVSN